MSNVEISGLKSAYKHAAQCAYGANMSISAALVVEVDERIAELEKALSDLIERAAQRGSWEHFPQSYLDDAFKVLLKEQGK